MNAFHVCGAILALWALLVAFLGITRESFPGNRGTERIIELISLVLVVLAVGTGLYTAATEDHGGGEGHEESSAVLPF